jgi:hypothetical protein
MSPAWLLSVEAREGKKVANCCGHVTKSVKGNRGRLSAEKVAQSLFHDRTANLRD